MKYSPSSDAYYLWRQCSCVHDNRVDDAWVLKSLSGIFSIMLADSLTFGRVCGPECVVCP